MSILLQSPSQTVGPFFSVGLIRPSVAQNVLVKQLTQGQRIRIEGTVYDGAGHFVEDALIEIWQADAHGRYRHERDTGPAALDPNFLGFGRCPTDARGSFCFETIKPGPVYAGDGKSHAPHVNVTVFARGMLVHAFTRMYFADDALERDPILAVVDPSRRCTLIGERVERGIQIGYRWDIHLQGEKETVFFDA